MPAQELAKLPRKLNAGYNFINKETNLPAFTVTEEFKKKMPPLSTFSNVEGEIAYCLIGDFKFWDISGLYSEASFEKSKYSDDSELKKIRFYVNELENGSLNPLLELYKNGKLAIIEYSDAAEENALDPQTVITVTGTVKTADFQFPLTDKRDQQYAKLILDFNTGYKIVDIKVFNKAFLAMIQASKVTTDGISEIKKKLDHYAKNKPVNDPNAEYEANDNWEKSIEQ